MHQAEQSTPEWLSSNFLQKALKTYKHDDTIEILNFNVKHGFSENFASTMFQCSIEFRSRKYPKSEPETLNVVIKAKPEDDGVKMRLVAGGPLFETEIKMYKETIPAIHQLFEQSGMKVEFEPELIYSATQPFPIIILKDLTQDGFHAPREPPEELEDSKMIIQRLAQFHASSFYLSETNQHDFTDYSYCFYENPCVIKEFFGDALVAFREVIETWTGFENYGQKLDYFIENFAEIGKKAYKANKPGRGFNVLNHGDFHTRNTLCKNNSNHRLESLYFIDYQLSVFCSPAIDLAYMFGMVKRDAATGEIPVDDLIMFYHEEFIKTLKAFGWMKTPPSLLDLNIELLQHGSINVLLYICFIPFSFIDWDKMSVNDLMGNDSERSRNFRKSLYDHPICKMLLQREMKSWVHKGWL